MTDAYLGRDADGGVVAVAGVIARASLAAGEAALSLRLPLTSAHRGHVTPGLAHGPRHRPTSASGVLGLRLGLGVLRVLGPPGLQGRGAAGSGSPVKT